MDGLFLDLSPCRHRYSSLVIAHKFSGNLRRNDSLFIMSYNNNFAVTFGVLCSFIKILSTTGMFYNNCVFFSVYPIFTKLNIKPSPRPPPKLCSFRRISSPSNLSNLTSKHPHFSPIPQQTTMISCLHTIPLCQTSRSPPQ